MQLYWVYLEDQAPPIGCGWRSVFADEGPRWTYLLDWTKLCTVRLRTQNAAPGEGWASVRHKIAGRSPTGIPAAPRFIRETMEVRLNEEQRGPTAREEKALALLASWEKKGTPL